LYESDILCTLLEAEIKLMNFHRVDSCKKKKNEIVTGMKVARIAQCSY